MTKADTLRKIAGHETFDVPVAELPGLLEVQAVDVAGLIAPLIADGSLCDWPDHNAGPAVCLSTEAAESLGLVLTEISTAKSKPPRFRWHTPASAPAKNEERKGKTGIVASDLECKGDMEWFDTQADYRTPDLLSARQAGIDEAIDLASAGRSRRDRFVPLVMQPRLLYGQRQSWPIPPNPDGTCSAHPAKIEPYSYCLWCQKSGVQHLLPKVPRHERPAAQTSTEPSRKRGNGLKGRVLTRKEKRRKAS